MSWKRSAENEVNQLSRTNRRPRMSSPLRNRTLKPNFINMNSCILLSESIKDLLETQSFSQAGRQARRQYWTLLIDLLSLGIDTDTT